MLVQIHQVISTAFLYFSALISLWALWHLIQSREFSGDFWGAIVIGEILVVVQALIGLILYFQGARPARGIHLLYGVVCVLLWPAVFAVTRGETSRRETLYWMLSSAFLFGLVLRAMDTALRTFP